MSTTCVQRRQQSIFPWRETTIINSLASVDKSIKPEDISEGVASLLCRETYRFETVRGACRGIGRVTCFFVFSTEFRYVSSKVKAWRFKIKLNAPLLLFYTVHNAAFVTGFSSLYSARAVITSIFGIKTRSSSTHWNRRTWNLRPREHPTLVPANPLTSIPVDLPTQATMESTTPGPTSLPSPTPVPTVSCPYLIPFMSQLPQWLFFIKHMIVLIYHQSCRATCFCGILFLVCIAWAAWSFPPQWVGVLQNLSVILKG